jgi:glutathione S-transferase
MSFAMEAALAMSTATDRYSHMQAWLRRARQRPAYQRALQKGGPILMS